ncbi:MAG: DUF1735 domain-containing protein [Bacteroidales bacterium]|nr:DUF1735 domain-containing protein [Bacteroides sp.]MCM1197454.1 DUF1735 domain-containing protein [Clostridium sp.]MCM1501180.1 DUF1735 domain-containing protein [Bacteroidales bacterium]
MKRNILISIILAAVTLLSASCSGKFEVGHDVDSSLYLLNFGKSELTVSMDKAVHSIYVCKGGLNDDVFAVSLAVDQEDLVAYNAKYKSSYRILPPNSYAFSCMNMLVGKDDVKTEVQIAFDYGCLPSGTSVLPVRLKCTSDRNVQMTEEYSVAYIFVTKE